jgi:hypothetical protein
MLVRGEAETAGRLVVDMHLAVREDDAEGSVADVLLNRASGLAEVVIPLRSKMIGQSVFPAMATEDDDLMVLGADRHSGRGSAVLEILKRRGSALISCVTTCSGQGRVRLLPKGHDFRGIPVLLRRRPSWRMFGTSSIRATLE